jgi:hypothetical protein
VKEPQSDGWRWRRRRRCHCRCWIFLIVSHMSCFLCLSYDTESRDSWQDRASQGRPTLILQMCGLACLSLTCLTISFTPFPRSFFQHNSVQFSSVQHISVQHSSAQHSSAQFSSAQFSSAQFSTVQFSTVQFSSVRGSTRITSPHSLFTFQYHVLILYPTFFPRWGGSWRLPSVFQWSHHDWKGHWRGTVTTLRARFRTMCFLCIPTMY